MKSYEDLAVYNELITKLTSHYGLPRRGKVRDTFTLPDGEHLLGVASDRISVYDFVLNASIRDKGAILTAMNVFWRRTLTGFEHDLVACGAGIDSFLEPVLRKDKELRSRAIVVKKLEMIPIECIVRGYLTGSGLDAYNETYPHVVCGHTLPQGLKDGSRLPQPIFTPTTKAEVGHDEHVPYQEVIAKYGKKLESISLSVYDQASAYALKYGTIIADTKLEIGILDGKFIIGDEILTPDSSRFWDEDEYQEAYSRGIRPPSHDKQYVREYARKLGVNKKDPKKKVDVTWVKALIIDEGCLDTTSSIYHNIFQRLSHMSLHEYQLEVLKISA